MTLPGSQAAASSVISTSASSFMSHWEVFIALPVFVSIRDISSLTFLIRKMGLPPNVPVILFPVILDTSSKELFMSTREYHEVGGYPKNSSPINQFLITILTHQPVH